MIREKKNLTENLPCPETVFWDFLSWFSPLSVDFSESVWEIDFSDHEKCIIIIQQNFDRTTFFLIFYSKTSWKLWKKQFFEKFTNQNWFSENKIITILWGLSSPIKFPKPILRMFDSFWEINEQLWNIFFWKTF